MKCSNAMSIMKDAGVGKLSIKSFLITAVFENHGYITQLGAATANLGGINGAAIIPATLLATF